MIDASASLPGRGAYLCREPSPQQPPPPQPQPEQAPSVPRMRAQQDGRPPAPRRECLQLARRRKAFARAFRRAVDAPDELVESVG